MNIKWFKYLKKDETKKDVERKVLASTEVLDLLKRILEVEVEATRKDKLKLARYILPAWGEFQADRNATERTLKMVIDLLPKE